MPAGPQCARLSKKEEGRQFSFLWGLGHWQICHWALANVSTCGVLGIGEFAERRKRLAPDQAHPYLQLQPQSSQPSARMRSESRQSLT